MKTKELIFDMDGTIADLYGVDNWLEKLRAKDVSPYREAAPLYDMNTLNFILEALKAEGYKVVVVSWGSKEASRNYNRITKIVKKAWLDHYGFPYDEIHVVKYGTPKQNYSKGDLSILVDDNEEVRNRFLKSKNENEKRVIDATKNIINELLKLF